LQKAASRSTLSIAEACVGRPYSGQTVWRSNESGGDVDRSRTEGDALAFRRRFPKVGSKLRLKIVHKGQDSPVEVTLARTPLRSRAVELRAQVDNGRLFVESVGAWPILDFEKEKPLMMMPQADGVFYLDSGDHTRIAFIRDSNGKVTEAVLNPGLWELRGRRLE
jgi:hypothetical protein